MAANPISSGSPHVRPVGVHRTCGGPDEIKKKYPPENNITALFRAQGRCRGLPQGQPSSRSRRQGEYPNPNPNPNPAVAAVVKASERRACHYLSNSPCVHGHYLLTALGYRDAVPGACCVYRTPQEYCTKPAAIWFCFLRTPSPGLLAGTA